MTVKRGALLGFGHVAEHGHCPAWLARRDMRIVAVADPAPGRQAAASRVMPTARVYADPYELLRQETLDFVDIAAPPALHPPLIVAASAAGCHILCEKPLATSIEGYQAVAAATRRAGVALFTVHNWKHSAQFIRVAGLLAEGAIGRVTNIRLTTVRKGRSVTVGSDWRGDAAVAGGGILVDHGWHAFYLLTGLAGERPERVRATLDRRDNGGATVEDTAECTVEFPSLTGEIRLTWAGNERRTSWHLQGERGVLELDESQLVLRRGTEIYRFAFPESLSAGSHHPDWFGAVIDEFVREIDDEAERGKNLAEAECCLMLLRLAYASSANNARPLPVPTNLQGTDLVAQ